MDMKFKIKPWEHQIKAMERALSMRDFAFLMEMGTGKTSTTINTLRGIFARNKRILRTLVLCPVVVCENWRREFFAHSQIGHQVVVLSGSGEKRLKTFLAEKDKRPYRIFITNYEAMQMPKLLQALLAWRTEILVCDESQRLKNPTSVRSKKVQMIADHTLHNFILSGSPIINKPLDIFSQYRILDRGATFGRLYTEFKQKYFIDENMGMKQENYYPDLQIREECVDEIHAKIFNKACRVLKNECLDLPDLVRQAVYVDLAPEQRRVYDEMRKQYIAYLDQGECTAQVAIVKALRLQQIVSGYIKLDSGEEIRLKDNPRLDALEDLISDLPRSTKFIVWANFRENYGQIADRLDKMKIKHVQLVGGMGGNKRQEAIDAFQTDPSVQAIVANQAAGGVGVNLTAASVAFFYSRNFSLEQDLQAEARNHRGGSEIHEKITRVDIVAHQTIDEIVLRALRDKLDMAERILELRTTLR